MNKTNISYLTYTWNPIHGCTPISEGCKNCWAKTMSKRLAGAKMKGYNEANPFKPTFVIEQINKPFSVRKKSIIGVGFMGDLFHSEFNYDEVMMVFDTMVSSNHTFVVLTKRPQSILSLFKGFEDYEPLHVSNIWFGCSVENNETLLKRMEFMQQLKEFDPEIKTWLSVEPLLEDIAENIIKNDIAKYIDAFVVGGESGHNARYCDPNWIMDISEAVGNKFYWKQWGTNKNVCPGKYYEESVKQMQVNPFKN